MPAPRVTSKNPLQVVLIADDSGSMFGPPAQAVSDGLQDFVAKLQSFGKGEKNYFKLLFIKFGDSPHVIYDFTPVLDVNSADLVVSGDSGTTNMDLAIAKAADRLEASKPESPDDPAPLVIFWSDGHNTGGDPSPAAQRIKALQWPCGSSPLFITCGFGEAEKSLLEALATSTEHYKELENAGDLEAFLGNVGTLVTSKGKSVDQVREEIKQL